MDPITNGQRKTLAKLGVDPNEIPDTKQEAKDLIWRLSPPTAAQARQLKEFGVADDEIPKSRTDATSLLKEVKSRPDPNDVAQLREFGITEEELPSDRSGVRDLLYELGGPVTESQRSYLINLGVPENEIPPSKARASELIDKVKSRPTDRQLEVLRDFVDETELPASKDEASWTIDFIKFVNACARTWWGSSRQLSHEDTRWVVQKLWGTYLPAIGKLASAEAREATAAEEVEDLENEICDFESDDEQPTEPTSLAKLKTRLEKAEARQERAEEATYRAEERLDKIQNWLLDTEEREDGKLVVSPDSDLARKVKSLLRERGIEPPKASGRGHAESSGCASVILIAVFAISIVTLVLA